MMKENRHNIYDSDSDIENLLRPRCSFHVSPQRTERIIEEAQSRSQKAHRFRNVIIQLAVAASFVAVVVAAVLHFLNSPTDGLSRAIAVRVVQEIDQDTVKPVPDKVPVSVYTARRHEKSESELQIHRKTVKVENIEDPTSEFQTEDCSRLNQNEVKGDMPMIDQEASIDLDDEIKDPDEVRKLRLENQRVAKLAYIDRIRNEIEENQSYIGQLISSIDVTE